MPSKYGLDPFYNSRRWRRIAAAYMNSKNYVCERCGQPATICHHRRWLNADNVKDPMTALCWDNLEALCQDCHNAEHAAKDHNHVIFDAAGHVATVRETEDTETFKRDRAKVDDVLKNALLLWSDDKSGHNSRATGHT